jgi:outer membrane protein assembly factor BamB
VLLRGTHMNHVDGTWNALTAPFGDRTDGIVHGSSQWYPNATLNFPVHRGDSHVGETKSPHTWTRLQTHAGTHFQVPVKMRDAGWIRCGGFGSCTLLAAGAVLAAGACGEIAGGTGKLGGDPPLAWQAALGSERDPHGTPAADGERVYAVVEGVSAYAARDGSLLWRAPVDTYSPRNVVTDGDRVYAAEVVAHAFDARTGAPVWRFRPAENASLGRSLVDGGVFYFGTTGPRVYALDARTGNRFWDTELGRDWEFGSVVRGLAASGDTLYAAVEQWRARNGYIASGWLFAMDRRTGEILWSYVSGTGTDRHGFGSSPRVAGRLLLASDPFSNAAVAVDRFTGEEVWRLRGRRGYVGFHEAPLVRGDTVYAASGDTYVYAADLATGAVLWETALPGAATAYQLCGERLLVNYLGLAVLDARSGALLRTAYEGADEFMVTEFARDARHVYVLGNRRIYAFRC